MLAATGTLWGRSMGEFAGVMEKTLRENIVAFWYPKTLDRKQGGYRLNHDHAGEWKGDGPKGIVTQARQVWLFARAARGGFGNRAQLLAAAEHGYQFLLQKMWDGRYGGFYWSVDAAGNIKRQPRKHLYGQAFGLYAVSEYARASGRADVLEFAHSVFGVMEAKAHDKAFGGYREFFEQDWTATKDGEASYMGGGGHVKLMNTHLHLMEAMTAYYLAGRTGTARARLAELVDIESNAVVRKELGACTDQYELDWTPRLAGNLARVSYGHDLENVWLIAEARQALGWPIAPAMDLFRTLWDYSMRYGWDAERGGFFYTGRFREAADDKQKAWWVQAEALVSALGMFAWTREAKYWEVFEKTWEFLDKHQIDWEKGEWHSTVGLDGTPRGDKAGIWKGGYHNGRAMMEAAVRLRRIEKQAGSKR